MDDTDAVLGRLLEGYGPEDLVLVVSDHGFENSRKLKGLTGMHRGALARNAILFARGPGIEAGAPIEDARIQDITPTILAWLGLALADDMDGRPLGFLEHSNAARIATYDTSTIERMKTGSAGAEEEIMEQLEALGYFEGDGGEAPAADAVVSGDPSAPTRGER